MINKHRKIKYLILCFVAVFSETQIETGRKTKDCHALSGFGEQGHQNVRILGIRVL